MHSVKIVVLVFVFLIHFNRNNEGNCGDPMNVTELDVNSLSYEYKNKKEARSSAYLREDLKTLESEFSIQQISF